MSSVSEDKIVEMIIERHEEVEKTYAQHGVQPKEGTDAHYDRRVLLLIMKSAKERHEQLVSRLNEKTKLTTELNAELKRVKSLRCIDPDCFNIRNGESK